MKKLNHVFLICLFYGLFLNFSQINAQAVSQQDSLALVDLYNNTDGDNWNINDNWLSGTVPEWYGVNISDGRVIEVNLDHNNLNGTIPSSIGDLDNLETLSLQGNQLSGSIPTELGNLTDLQNLYLNNNQFTDLPVLTSLTSLDELQIQNNQFTFKDIEPNMGVAGSIFFYAPQDEVGNEQDTTVFKGTDLTLVVSTGGSNSQYQWKKDWENIGDVSGDNTYTISSIDVPDAGSYTCEITNTVATELTLYSRPMHVFVRPPRDAGVIALLTPGECGLTDSETITVQIQNIGTDPISDFDVNYQIDDDDAITETVYDEIPPGETLDYAFAGTADLSANGFYALSSWTSLQDDENPDNDHFGTSISNCSAPYTMGFEHYETEQKRWFVIVDNDDGNSWEIYDDGGSHSGDSYYQYSYHEGNDANDWIISHCFNLEEGVDYAVSFWYRSDGTSNLNLKLGSFPNTSSMDIDLIVLTDIPYAGYTEVKQIFTVPDDGVYYFAFQVNGVMENSGSIRIDDFIVREAPLLDAKAISLISPENDGCGFTGSEEVIIEIANWGLDPISDFEVGYTLNDVPIAPETVTDVIQPGDTIEYTFNTRADLYTNEYFTQCTFEFYTLLQGDEAPENDALHAGINFYGDYIDKEGWTTYSICDGLANRVTTGIVEDASGNYWIGTGGGGVNVFDGDTWITYNTENSPLTSNSVETMFADDLGNIWIGTWQDEGGVCMYDGSTWTIYTTENSGIPNNVIEEIIQDSDGNNWFATYYGISKFDGSTWTNYDTENSGLVHNRANAITEDSDGNIWIGTDGGASKFDVSGDTWMTYDTENSGLQSNRIFSVEEDNQGNVWFGTYQGWVTRFDGSIWTTYTIANSGISNYNVLSIMVDSDGDIWFGTFGDGAVRYDGTSWIIYDENNGLTTGIFPGYIQFWGDIYEDSNGSIWFPTYNGLVRKEPVAIEVYKVEFSHSTCNGTDDGTITIYALAENPPLQYSVDGGNSFQPGSLFENLPPGTYSIAVTDGTDTVFTDPVNLLDFADISSFPFTEDFDSYDVESTELDNGWYNEISDDIDWKVWSGSTPTHSTGPWGDHTSGDGNYLYMEASVNYFKQATLISPCIDISSLSIPNLIFWYHMWGENMGELHIDIYAEGTWNEDVVVLSGDHGDEWHQQWVDLSDYSGIIKLRFRGIIGDYAFSDIAIDDIEILEGPISAEVISMIEPEGGCGYTDSEDVTIEIINDGLNAIADFDVGYTMNGVPITPETITDTIYPGDTLIYTFSTRADLYTTEYYYRYNFQIYTLLPGDVSPENDTLWTNRWVYGDYTDKEGWTTYTICDGMAAKVTTGVVEDGSGNIWVGMDPRDGGGGVSVFDGDTWITYNTENSPLTSNSVETVFADDLGNVWIGTWRDEGGVCMYDGSSWTIYTTETSGIAGNLIEEIIKDSDGNYWFATYNGISKFDGSTWTNYNTGNSGLADDRTNAIMEDSNGNIWIGTESGVSKFDITGDTWTTYDTDNSGLESNRIFSVKEDAQGDIWIGTWQGWVTRFDGSVWTTYTPGNSGVLNISVLSIMEDSDGNIWFGTFGSGAVKYDGTNWINYNGQNGLVNGNFWGDIYEDSNGNIWFPTYNGLAKKEPVNVEIYRVKYSHCACNGTDDGAITIYALAENPPLEYSVDGGITFQPDSLFENLPPGTYSIAVTDGIDTVFADTVEVMDFADISSFPFIEDFDSYDVPSAEFDNGWINEITDNMNWRVWTGNTPSQNTGPGEDHTTGGGNYLYVEASANYFKRATLISPCFDISGLSIPTLRFFYNMYGENMGELHLDICADGTWHDDVFVVSGDQGYGWRRCMMDLSGYGDIVKLRFRGIIGDYVFSDIALDDIEIMEGPVDARIRALIAPQIPLPARIFCGLTNNEQITVEVINNGTHPLSNFEIGYTINEDPIDPEIITEILQFGDTINYTFNATADLYSTEYLSTYSLDVYILLPGDENPENNSRHFDLNSFGDYTDKYRWTSINSCDGLLDDHVFASFEDNHGNMWFSGFYGVSKFDGTNWTTYTSEDGLADDYTWAMTDDSQGNIWFATTSGGITLYDGTDFTVHQSETGVFEECVFEDSQGNIWFGSYQGDGVLKFDGTDWTHYTHDEGILGNVVLSISEDKNGNMLFSSHDGVSLFDGTNWSELPMDGQGSLHISEIFKDSQDNVWFTESWGDYFKFDGTEWTTYSTDDGILNHRCEDIAEDNNGNLWFGGRNIINVFNGSDWQNLGPEDGLIECEWGIYSVTADHQDNIWFGTGKSGVSKFVSVPTVQHFELSWTGNGVDHMNFYALSAILDGSDLQPGDEIAVFDGEYCVGAGVITEVLGGGVYLDFVASRNDAVPPSVNGYTPGNEVLFRIWDASEDAEIDNLIVDYVSGEGIYSIGGTVSFNLTASSEIDQSIDLASGWNIMSFNVEPQEMGMDLILQSLINGGILVKVQDETGQAIENVPPIGWIYNIGDMSPSEGYKIKVNDNTQLLSTGYAVDLPYSISLNEGWNILGYPSPQGQDAQQMLSSLISDGSLLKVQDEQGNAIENVPPIGWIYNIPTFEPGEGYKIKVDVNTSLLITESTKKSAFTHTYDLQPKHFVPSWEGNGLDHMNIYLISPTVGGQKLNPGDEIGIYDGTVCVGYGIVGGADQRYLSLVASRDDPTTDITDGFTEGHPIRIVLWIAGADVEKPFRRMTVTSGYATTFEKLGTTVLYPDFEPYVVSFLGDAYPNPFTDQTTIAYGLGSDTHVKIEIYNIVGEKLAVLVNKNQKMGIYQVTWNGGDLSGHLSPGIYFYKMVTGDYSDIKRVIFIK